MNTYLWLKWIHVVSSVVLVGTGLGTAFYMFFTNRSGSVQAQAVVSRLVVRADWWFTTPAVVVQPLSGFAMVYLAGYPLSSGWILISVGLYTLAGACWVPVVWLQIRMAAMAQHSAQTGTPLPALYGAYARRWEALGYPAFMAMLGIFYLMVVKPNVAF